jgi:hypothetical protein
VGGTSGRGRVNEEGKGGYFLYLYEYRTLKPVEVISRRRVGGEGE